MLALQQAIAEARRGDTVLRNSPAYNPQSNGGAEKAMQDVTDLMRRMLFGLEAKLRGRLDLTCHGRGGRSCTPRSCSRGYRLGTTA